MFNAIKSIGYFSEYMLEVDQFVEKYNEYLDNKRERFPDVKLIEKVRHTEFDVPLDYFLKSHSFPTGYNYASFCFEQDADIPEGLRHFATHVGYNLFYAEDQASGGIVLYDFEFDCIEWLCADSIRHFFRAMTVVISTEITRQERRDWTLPESFLKVKFEECLDLSGGRSEYEVFYNHILGL